MGDIPHFVLKTFESNNRPINYITLHTIYQIANWVYLVKKGGVQISKSSPLNQAWSNNPHCKTCWSKGL